MTSQEIQKQLIELNEREENILRSHHHWEIELDAEYYYWNGPNLYLETEMYADHCRTKERAWQQMQSELQHVDELRNNLLSDILKN